MILRPIPGICAVVPITSFCQYGAQLKLCLLSIARQSVGAENIDIVVSYMPKAGSGDRLPGALLRRYRATLVYGPKSDVFLPALIRNIGGRWARREFLTFIDADAVLHPQVFEASIGEGGPNKFTYVQTAMCLPPVGSPMYREALSNQRVFNRLVVDGRRARGTGCCTVTTLEDFHRLRGFNELIRGYGPTDIEFTDRLVRANIVGQNLSSVFGMYNLHQNHPRVAQDDPSTPDRVRNHQVYMESKQADGYTPNEEGWGQCLG